MKTAAELAKKRKIWNGQKFWRSQNVLTGLRNHCFKQEKGNQLVITKKNNEHNQKLTQIVVGEWIQWDENKNATMVLKSLKMFTPWSHFNVIFSDG